MISYQPNGISPPCKVMANIDYVYEESDFGGDGKGFTKGFTVSLSLPDNVKLIKHSKQIDVQTLVGNVGGYIGLFLGAYAFLN